MDRFINRLNLDRYRRLLTGTTDETQRQTLLNLISSEEEIEEQIRVSSHPGSLLNINT
jgi:hypothetical protein